MDGGGELSVFHRIRYHREFARRVMLNELEVFALEAIALFEFEVLVALGDHPRSPACGIRA